MDTTKGIHGLATTIFILLLAYTTYPYFESFFTGVEYDVFKYILWGTYILIIVVTSTAVPIIIITQPDSDASIFSALGAVGLYALGALVMRIATPFAQIFVGEGYSNVYTQGIFQGAATGGQLTQGQATQAIGWMSILWIVAVVFFLVIIPITMAIAPHMFEKAKEAIL